MSGKRHEPPVGYPPFLGSEDEFFYHTGYWKLKRKSRLLRKYFSGVLIDSPASMEAAKCNTASGRCSRKAASSLERSAMSPVSRTTSDGTASRCPLLRLS